MVLLTRYNGELREPLLWRQGSQVSMRVARGSASLLSSHGRGIAPQDALKKDSRGLLRVGAGNPWFPRLVPVISGRSKGASEKSGLLCSWEGPLGTPLGSVQWKKDASLVEMGISGFLSYSDVGLGVCMPFQRGSQASACVEAWNSAFLFGIACQGPFQVP